MKKITISRCASLALTFVCAGGWAQGQSPESRPAQAAAGGPSDRDKWIGIALDSIRKTSVAAEPVAATTTRSSSGIADRSEGLDFAAAPVAQASVNAAALSSSLSGAATGTTRLRSPLDIAAEVVSGAGASPLLPVSGAPASRTETTAAAVNRVLTDTLRSETAKRAQQAKFLRRALLASNNSLDSLMILEMIQNRGIDEDLAKDIPSARDELPPSPAGDVQRDPRAQRIIELYEKEDYRAAGEQGFPLLDEFPNDNRLRLVVANSLAWSSTRYQDAIAAYRPLLDTPDSRDASLGLANVYRWSGRDDLAMPLYKKLIAQTPDNKDVREGMMLTERAMRPRTMISMGTASDTNNMQRQELTLNHRWRSPSGSGIFEIEAGGTNDTQPDLASYQRNITLRYQGLDLPFQPTFDITEQTGPQQNIYGGVNLKLTDDTQFIANRVNWGLLSFNTAAELANLSAYHFALATSKTGDLGNMRIRVDYFGVSDNNSVVIGNLQYTPPWRPFGEYLKPYVGISTRDQSNYSPLYWSPVNGGYGVYFVGMQAEWSNATSSLYGSAQIGNGLYGEGGFNWGLSLGGRTWINDDYAIGAKLNKYAGGQYGPSYSFTSALVTLERAW